MTSKAWKGEAVAVLATGPSLTIEDIQAVYQEGLLLVGVNSAWKMAPYVDVIYAGDERYWKAYDEDIRAAGIEAKRFSRSSRAEKVYGAKYTKTRLGKQYNSGQMAVEFAILRGASSVVMLGFDASVKHGLHCHGGHDKTPNPTPERARKWLKQFDSITEQYPESRLVNCSRQTAIKSIPRIDLEWYLARLPESPLRSTRKEKRVRAGTPKGWHGLG